MKFKPGDKVVFYQSLLSSISRKKKFLGTTLTIEHAQTRNGEVEYVAAETRSFYFIEPELVLEDVYNSPLFQALK